MSESIQNDVTKAPKNMPAEQEATKMKWQQYIDNLSNSMFQKIAEMAKNTTFKINEKDYQRSKITIKQHKELEQLRAKLTKEKDEEIKSDLTIDVYAKCAEYYLGMTRDEFDSCYWEDMRIIIDACNFRTNYGTPYSHVA